MLSQIFNFEAGTIHAYTVLESCFSNNRKFAFKDCQALLRNEPVLVLGFLAGTNADVVNPAPQRACHIHRGRRTQRQDSTRSFLGDPTLQHVLVKVVALTNQPLRFVLQFLLSEGVNVVDAVLPILFVLTTKPGHTCLVSLGIPSRKFLERERTVPCDLSGDVSLRIDLNAHGDHLKR